MTGWRRVRIGDVCEIVKGETGLASATPGEYPLVATGAERRSCISYQFDTEAVCIPLVSSTGHGKKTLNYVHYQSGKFALGTILAAVIPKNPKNLTARYLHLYLSHFKDTVLVPLMKGAANVSLPIKGIASVEIPVPSVSEQQKLIDLIGRIESEHRELLEEGNRQAGLFKQLRQAVLQEAVEGKLTADWRKRNLPPFQGEGRGGDGVKGDPNYDAAALLAQIKAEKERLVKAGKIRKEKPLAPISESEKPFELPAGWVWCRLGGVSIFIDYRGKTPTKVDSGIRLITAKNVKKGFLSLEPSEFITEKEYKTRMTRGFPTFGDIFFTTEAPLGNACLNSIDGPFAVGQRIITVKPHVLNSAYLLNALLSQRIQSEIDKRKTGLTAKGIKSKKLVEVPIPLPPIAEQQAIVARVDNLMAMIEELEHQVAERKEQAQMLMRAVLREAFAGGEGVEADDACVGATHASPDCSAPRATRARHASPLRESMDKTKRPGLESAHTGGLPLVAETTGAYKAGGQATVPAANQSVPGGIPTRILAAMQPGRDHSRAELLGVTGISEADWIWAIRQLREQGRVVQMGEKRGARYVRR